MNYPYTAIQNKKRWSNENAFLAFFDRLKNPLQQEKDHAFASVLLTFYRKNRLERHHGIILLINGGYGTGNIRIADGDESLMNEQVFHVLERNDHCYSLGRTGTELVIDCIADSPDDIYRIDIEENTSPVLLSSTSNQEEMPAEMELS